jgi:long-chain acyl-CoA synthetase
VTANLAELLTAAAAAAPDAPALVEAGSGDSTTWAELEEQVSRLAGGFDALGLVAGNRVVIATANRPEFVVCYLAALRALLVAVPVNPRSATGELVRMVADCGARLIVADSTTIVSARAVAAGLHDALAADPRLQSRVATPRLMALDCAAESGEVEYAEVVYGPGPGPLPPLPGTAAAAEELPPPRDRERLAVLLYTSGTSAEPRAAMLTHRALLANLQQAARVEPPMVGPSDVVYGVLPLFHVYGLNAVLGQVLHQRARLVVAESFDPVASLEQVQRHRVTVLPVAPAVLAQWSDVPGLAERLTGVRTVVSGAAPLSPDLAEDFRRRTGLTVHQGYGLTEAAPVVTSTLCSKEAKPGSVGAALPGVLLRLVDDSGRVPEGEDPGEILVAGDNLFDGYWPDGRDGPVEGWFATGDIGFLDADGDLFLLDRVKDVVIVSGFNVYPSEVEDVLRDAEGVAEAAVVGVPDDRTGEAVVAYVRPEGARSDRAAVEQRAREACERRLARFKQPARIEVVDQLPRTITGKVAKGRLRDALRQRDDGLLS